MPAGSHTSGRAPCGTCLPRVRGLFGCLIVAGTFSTLLLIALGNGSAASASGQVGQIALIGKPITVYDEPGRWAELPEFAVAERFVYVVFDVRDGDASHLEVCRVPRGGERSDTSRLRIDAEAEIEFEPAISMERGRAGAPPAPDALWVAWSACRDGAWKVRACRVEDMAATSRLELADAAFPGQVAVASAGGRVCFAWAVWEDDAYAIEAAFSDDEPGHRIRVYEGPNPVGRPDLGFVGDETVSFVWDEYVDGRFVIRTRQWSRGLLGETTTLSGGRYSNDWEPHITGSGDKTLVVWHSVPGSSARCQPAAAIPGQLLLAEGVDSPDQHETWRVRCFTDDGGETWIAWATRFQYRSNKVYLRRISEVGMGETLTLADLAARRGSRSRSFVNWFGCAHDDGLIVVWESPGSVYMSEMNLPEGPASGSVEEPLQGALPGGGVEARPADVGRDGAVAGGDEARAEEDEYEEADLAPEIGRAAELQMYQPSQRPTLIEYSTVYEGESLHVYFGDYHNHTSYSDGRAFPDVSLLLARDWRLLDFACVTDHDNGLTPGEYEWSKTVADRLTLDGRFVCLQGFEASKGWARHDYGHWNMLFPGPSKVLRYGEGMLPTDLYGLAERWDAVLVPHHVAKRFAPHSWDFFDPVAEPVVEMCSVHGVFESVEGNEGKTDMLPGHFVQDGLARGYRLGVVGGSDSHNCFQAMLGEYGLTGAYAGGLDRTSIFEAFNRRRTFALTGGRIVLDFRCNGRMMGEEVCGPEGLSFRAYACSPDSLASIEVVSGGTTVFEHRAQGTEATFDWEAPVPDREAYYYLRVRTAKGDRAWSSPIWIVPKP